MMDDKKLEILSNIRLIPFKEKERMYESIINHAKELFGARRIVLYVKEGDWRKEFSYPSEEMLGFELDERWLDDIYKKLDPHILSFDKAKELGINIEGVTVFLPLGTKDYGIGILLLSGIKSLEEEIEEEIPIFKVFARYLEIYLYALKELIEKREISGAQDPLESLKEEIISMISRNLRTPLASILAYAETLKEGGNLSEKEKAEFIETIYKESMSLKNAIEDMMGYITIFTEE